VRKWNPKCFWILRDRKFSVEMITIQIAKYLFPSVYTTSCSWSVRYWKISPFVSNLSAGLAGLFESSGRNWVKKQLVLTEIEPNQNWNFNKLERCQKTLLCDNTICIQKASGYKTVFLAKCWLKKSRQINIVRKVPRRLWSARIESWGAMYDDESSSEVRVSFVSSKTSVSSQWTTLWNKA
jgi:hypothetical protein